MSCHTLSYDMNAFFFFLTVILQRPRVRNISQCESCEMPPYTFGQGWAALPSCFNFCLGWLQVLSK